MEEKDEKSANHVFDTEVISFDIAQKDKYELDLQGKFKVVLREGKYYVERIKPKYPRTYEECAKILLERASVRNDIGYKGNLLIALQRLLVCRDVYWKIAGDEMGLGKPWEPDWTIYKHKFCLGTDKDKVIEECVTTGNRILAFPTEEMRDAFYENFNDLIEDCRELL